MTSMLATTFETSRPAGIPWTKMPTWFHLATIVYFATNIFNGWAFVHLRAPLLPTALALFGLTGGFIEHISPYFPKLYVHPLLEKVLFRIPTVLGIVGLGLWLHLAWFVVAVFVVQGIIFLREEPITSMEPRFHAQHVFGTHVFGSVQMYLLILVVSGQIPALGFLLAH